MLKIMSLLIMISCGRAGYQEKPPQTEDLDIEVLSPKPFQQVQAGSDLVIQLNIDNFQLTSPKSPPQYPIKDQGHYYIFLDSSIDSEDYTTAWHSSTVLHIPEEAETGRHVIRISLRSTNSEPLGVEKLVVIQVTAPLNGA